MPFHAPSHCPVCGETMEVTRLHCEHCNTELTGRFSPCRFCMLEPKQLEFVETFLRCRGSIKEVEKALGVSYPTVRNMLDASLEALGFAEPAAQADPTGLEREQVLAQLADGEIDVDTAVQALKNLKGE